MKIMDDMLEKAGVDQQSEELSELSQVGLCGRQLCYDASMHRHQYMLTLTISEWAEILSITEYGNCLTTKKLFKQR